MENNSTLSSGLTSQSLKAHGNQKKTFLTNGFWITSTVTVLAKFLVVLAILFTNFQFTSALDQNYDMNGKHVTYYPESLMISHNPNAVVFYHDTTLFNLLVTLRTPNMGRDFDIILTTPVLLMMLVTCPSC